MAVINIKHEKKEKEWCFEWVCFSGINLIRLLKSGWKKTRKKWDLFEF